MILHRGAREATIDEIARVVTPPPTGTWYPIPHLAVMEAAEETLQATAFGIKSRRLALSANSHQFFATLDLLAPIGEGSRSASVSGTRSKALPLGLCAGHHCFACDNISFSAELLVNRKHSVHGGIRLREAFVLAAGRPEAFQRSEAARIGVTQTLALDDPTAESLILRAWEAKIISIFSSLTS
jgi:hypothetical protein